jgi:hypothetical protein
MSSLPGYQDLLHAINGIQQRLQHWSASGQYPPLLDRDLMREQVRHLYLLLEELPYAKTAEPMLQVSIEAITPDPVQVEASGSLTTDEFSFERLESIETGFSPSGTGPEVRLQAVMQIETLQEAEPLPSDPTPGIMAIVQEQAGTSAEEQAELTTWAERFHAEETLGDKIVKEHPSRTLSDTLRDRTLSDLHQSIGVNERFGFINGLFKGDQLKYFAAIDELNACTTAEAALNYIQQDIRAAMGWKKDPPALADFIDLVRRRFHD